MKKLKFNFVLLIIGILLFAACPPESSISGCMQNIACNYNPNATEDDGSCHLPDGCTDLMACNYSAEALCDNGGCLYDADALPNPIEITFIEDYVTGLVGEELISHVHLRNASCEDMVGLSVRKFFSNPDVSAYFCFNGICFPSSTLIAPNPLNLGPFEEDDFFKSYLNASSPGTFEVTYRFFLENDGTQFKEVTIVYEVN